MEKEIIKSWEDFLASEGMSIKKYPFVDWLSSKGYHRAQYQYHYALFKIYIKHLRVRKALYELFIFFKVRLMNHYRWFMLPGVKEAINGQLRNDVHARTKVLNPKHEMKPY